MSFFDKIRQGLEIITGYIALAIDILTKFNAVMPIVVEFIIEQVDSWFGKIEKGEATGEQAREAVVQASLQRFHGSGPVIAEQDIRTIVEQYVKIAKARRMEFDNSREVIAVQKGYVKQTELEKVRLAWPTFQPLD